MNLLKRFFNTLDKLKLVYKITLSSVFLLIIIGVVVLIFLPSPPKMVSVIDAPIRNEEIRDIIILRINQEGVRVSLNREGIIMVDDENTAKRIREIIISEDLLNPFEKTVELDSRDKTGEIDIYKFFLRNRHYYGNILLIAGTCLFIYSIFTLIYGEKLGKIVASIVLILLGIVFLLP